MDFIKRHPLLTISLIVLVGVGYVTANTYIENQSQQSGGGWGGDGPTLVVTEPARLATIIDKVESIGTAQANESVLLTAKVTDTVRKVNFDDGDYVEEGDILVELTNAEETAQLAEAQATVEEATRQFERVRNLIEQNLASETQLDERRVQMQTAEARLNAIVARLENRLIRAPFSGVLGFRNVSPGTLLTTTTPVTTIDDIGTIKLDFDVPETYLARIKPSQEVIARNAAYPDRVFEGVVRTVGSRVDPVTRTLTVRAHLENSSGELRPGMLMTVDLVFDREQALVVPEASIVPIQDKEYVYVVGADNVANRREVTSGRRRPGIVEVTSGIEAGEEVITQGIIKVRPGARVARREDGTPADLGD